MATWLGVDASAAGYCVALQHQGVVYERCGDQSREQTQSILPAIHALLAETSISLSALDALVLGVGPGRFTGLRVASGIVQGFAMGLDLPVVRVSSLQAMAMGAHRRHPAIKHFWVLTNAHMGEVYSAPYVVQGSQSPLLGSEALLELDSIGDAPWDASWIAVGEGWSMPHETIAKLCAKAAAVVGMPRPESESLMRLGALGFESGEGVVSYEGALPCYLRGPDAWRKSG